MVSIRIVFIGGRRRGVLVYILFKKLKIPPPPHQPQDKKQLSIHTSVRLAF